MAEKVRLQKFLSQAGVASRRASEELITAGRVKVNGRPATELGTKVDPSQDRVHVDGRRIRPAPQEWYALNKPRGYMSTRSDPEGRPTLYELVPASLHKLFYVGRLDFDSEGLVLLTNDGDTANRLLHPRYEVDREYEVELRQDIESDALDRLKRGVELDDGPARAESVHRKSGNRIVLTVREGRKREVRRMFDAVGHEVVRLRRVRYGPIRLGQLALGQWRHLDDRELDALERLTGEQDGHTG